MEYTVPHFNSWKVLEMPLLGYLGFPPFALEYYLSWQAFLLLRSRILSRGGVIPVLALVAVLGLCLAAFWGIDRCTVVY